jgi:hypothetical protein
MKLKMKSLNLLEACSIMGDALTLRMALVSNREAMSKLMPLLNCLTLLRAKHPWFRIMKDIFYTLLIILSTKLGELMLGNLIMFLIMLLCIRMRLLALDILYPFDGSASPVYMAFSLPRCRLDMFLPLLCTCHPSFCHCKNYCAVVLGVSFLLC